MCGLNNGTIITLTMSSHPKAGVWMVLNYCNRLLYFCFENKHIVQHTWYNANEFGSGWGTPDWIDKENIFEVQLIMPKLILNMKKQQMID